MMNIQIQHVRRGLDTCDDTDVVKYVMILSDILEDVGGQEMSYALKGIAVIGYCPKFYNGVWRWFNQRHVTGMYDKDDIPEDIFVKMRSRVSMENPICEVGYVTRSSALLALAAALCK